MKILLTAIIQLFFFSSILFGQEICDNGMDDDGDGAIDLLDPDCICGSIEADEVEGDFEEFSCCPTNFTSVPGDGIYCLDDGWELVTLATADYVNECGYLGGGGIPPVPLPMPSGSGAVGQITLSSGYTEYVGYCMECAMVPGLEYDIEFFIGFNEGSGWTSSLNVEYAIYGNADCGALGSNGLACILDEPGWEEMGTFSVNGVAQNTWIEYSGSFIANIDALAIAIGPSCDWATSNGSEYHFLDALVIEGDFLKESDEVEVELEGDCVSGVTLESEDDGISVQWYLDGIAIDGATDNPYTVDPTMPGTYQVLVDYGGGECAISDLIDVDIDLDVLELESELSNIDCPGDDNGSIIITPNSPNDPLIYEWSNGEDSDAIFDLPGGSYTVTVTDANGCFTVETFIIEEPTDLEVDFVVIQPTGMGFGESEIFPEGGTPEYDYNWNNGTITNFDDELIPGIYTVTITDANGCQEFIEFEIFEPFEVVEIINHETCFEFCDGNIELEITGGQTPYEIDWNVSGSDPELTDLCPGIFLYTVTDAFGTQVSGEIEILPAPEFFLTFDYPQIVCEEDETSDIDMEIEGGVGPFMIEWNTGSNEEDLENVEYGTFAVTVTDDTGCQLNEVLYIDLSPPIIIEVFTSDLECEEGAEGFIDLEIEGGTEPFDFDWSNGDDSQNIDDLLPGLYTVTVTDLNGCQAIEEISINSNSSISVSAVVDSVSCAGDLNGAISLEIEGGTMPYNIQWETGEEESEITDLQVGDYSVTVTDAANCVFTSTYTVGQLSAFEATPQVDSISCADIEDGILGLDIIQSTGQLSFDWSNGEQDAVIDSLPAGIYDLTVTDSLSCEYLFTFELLAPDTFDVEFMLTEVDCFGDSTGQIEIILDSATDYEIYLDAQLFTDSVLTQLTANDYVIDLIDANGCQQSYDLSISEPDPIVANPSLINPDCQDSLSGSITLMPSGGTGNYSFEWEDGELTNILSGLKADTYRVTISDDRGCSIIEEYTLNQEASIEVDISLQNPSCFEANDGVISLDMISGNSPFDISWSNSDMDEVNDNLTAGVYYLTIVDAENCEYLDSITLTEPEEIIIVPELIDPQCFGDDGTITVELAGGTGQLEYNWSNGQSNEPLEDGAGLYEINVIDENNCEFIVDYELIQPDELSVELVSLMLPSQAGNDGLIEVTGLGGTEPYEYDWSNGSMDPSNDGLGFGVFSVTITDVNGCQSESTFDFDPDPLLASVEQNDNPCFSACQGSFSVLVENGLEPYIIEWSNGEEGPDINNLCNGIYDVSITDGLDSTIVLSGLEILSPEPIIVSAVISDESCFEQNDGQIELQLSGGQGALDIDWSNNEPGSYISNLAPANYSLTITDENGCTLDSSFVIEAYTVPDIDISIEPNLCDESGANIIFDYDNNESISFTVDGNLINLDQNNTFYLDQVGEFDIAYQGGSSCTVELLTFEIEEVFVANEVFINSFASLDLGEFIQLTPDLTEFGSQIATTDWILNNNFSCVNEDVNGNCLSIEIQASQSELVTLVITDLNGCQYVFEYRLDVQFPDLVNIPNIFSPDNNGENDVFNVLFSGSVLNIENFQIFDRWGNVVYDVSNINPNDFAPWDGRMNGTQVNEGVYVYIIQLTAVDNSIHDFAGDLTLIR